MGGSLQVSTLSLGRIAGASPSEHRYYVLVMFDIAEPKKYRLLIKTLKRYATRIQKSVFEARLKPRQIKELAGEIERLMGSERYFCPEDNVRIYRMASRCDATVFGTCSTTVGEEDDIFI